MENTHPTQEQYTINTIAASIYRAQGYQVDSQVDLSNAKHPEEQHIYNLAEDIYTDLLEHDLIK